ncbi:hypothetical protein V9T40_000762 [Parthenolecanium corni]|uniref:Uncharacterized protein n=1 Tax=Parthenolecanium corni TaxID=536013 RepID=A0AAN9T9Y1_9HEMI
MCFLGQANFDFTFQRKANIVTRAKKRARMSTRNRYCIIQPALLPSLTGSDQENDLAKIKDFAVIGRLIVDLHRLIVDLIRLIVDLDRLMIDLDTSAL